MGKYIRAKYKTIAMFLLYLGIFCLVAYLYRMPPDAMLYAAALCLFFSLIFMASDYLRYRQRILDLKDAGARIEFGPENLPVPKNGVEEQYKKMIEKLYVSTSNALSRRDRELTDMVGYYTLWAHQIKTPIAAMRLILQSDAEIPDRDEMKMELFKIEQYVEMVLQYLRIGSDSTDFLIRRLSLDKLIRDSVKKYSTTFIKKKISLVYEPVACQVISDEKWLCFVLEQLLSNALKYTQEGRISIYLDENEPSTLIIEDTGIGIQEEDLPRIFDKGYTGYNGRKDKKSTGIGLYLCRQIVDKLGHTLSIESQVGEGTKVRLGLAYKSVRFE